MHPIVAPLLFASLAGCHAPGVAVLSGGTADTDDVLEPGDTRRVSGSVVGAGFGTAVAISGDNPWVGAPYGDGGPQDGGRVYRLELQWAPDAGESDEGDAGDGAPGEEDADSYEVIVALVLEAGGLAGVALGTDRDGTLLVGAPLYGGGAGAVLDEAGAPLLQGAGVGRAVAAGPIALDQDGRSSASDLPVLLPARATSIATAGEQIGVGMPFGDVAMIVGDSSWARPEAGDEAGFALAAGDVDGDGVDEWIVGAPAANLVYVVDHDGAAIVQTLTGTSGRFGSAVAASDLDGDGRAEVLIGAPRAPQDAGQDAGQAFLFSGSDDGLMEVNRWTGEPQDRLGTSVALGSGRALVGAPGGPYDTGSALLISKPLAD
jgi:hypothetical protein